ncbi:MAG TPA: DUF1800 domain-containing protein [Thermoanaerobaculia bacterium]|nr:DUF1800 domain-containing protein [Thermoanaerobaculia bacterium]HQR66934.1 DUF1800 domain-containing protein [Thermoanaerobaculia bacterium]
MDRDAAYTLEFRSDRTARGPRRGIAALLALGALLASLPAAAQQRGVFGTGSGRGPGFPGSSSSSYSGDVVRFLEQATFGPTDALAKSVQKQGIRGYLDAQLNSKVSSYPDFSQVPDNSSVGCPTGSPSTCVRDNYTLYPLQVRFFQNALNNEDQLRQRVALALHEILVVSGVKLPRPKQMGPYLNMLLDNAFENYRKILYDLTVSPAMGRYLDMVNNDAPNPKSNVTPNENYAREVLQLFSVGVDLLNPDGSPQLDRSGNTIPTYTQDNIEDLAHVFTGWTYAPIPPAASVRHNPANYSAPMVLYRDANGKDVNHDKSAKVLLSYRGAVHMNIPADQDGEQELNDAIDNIFHHPNVGPFIGRQLIQHLVTSNPSPAYVARVTRVFNNNGAGVRGDMKAVIRAILLDSEARGTSKSQADYGHLREPVLFLTNILRAVGASSDGILMNQANAMGQNLFNPATVFSYFPYDFELTGTDTDAPEFGIVTSLSAINRANLVNTLTFSRINVAAPDPGTALDLTSLTALAADPNALLAFLNQLLMHGAMPADMLATVKDAVTAIPATNPLLRAQTALYLVASSSQYQVAR